MPKGRMIRSPRYLRMVMILAVGVFLCVAILPGTGLKDCLGRIVGQYSPLGPDEVIVYEHANFVGNYYVFSIEPGMRQKLVPDLKNFNDVISSIQVGSQVGVIVFEHGGFRDSRGGYLLTLAYPSYQIYNESKKVLTDLNNDSISSLIVFRKGQEAMGVLLYDQHWNTGYSQFFPLPELEKDAEAKYSALGPMDDDANKLVLYPRHPQSPGYGKVRVTMHEHPDHKGRWITLPGADGSIPPDGIFKMNSYQFDDTASSLIVRWTGPPPPLQVQVALPPPPPPPSTSTRVVAPPAPDTKQAESDRTPPAPGTEAAKAPSEKTPPLPPAAIAPFAGISGQWNSNIGAAYEIQQSGEQFTWSAPSLNQSGAGTISGIDVTMSGAGWTVKGTVTETDASGQPTKIVGENGVILFRTAAGPAVPAPPPAQQPVPPAPPTPPIAVNPLSGQWNSNIGAIYEIQQSGKNFTWSAPSLNQSGTGTISGIDVTMSGPGWTVKGTITETDASGRPTKIVGENGVILFRSATGKD